MMTVQQNQKLSRDTSNDNRQIYCGVGAEISPDMSVSEQLEAANLDWEVDTTAVRYGEDMQYRSSHRRALYRVDTGDLLDTVGPGWTPFQNHKIVEIFNTYAEKSELELEHLGSLRGGRCIFATAKLNEQFELPGDDIVTGRLLLTNYHQQGAGLKVDLMSTRLVCLNGMTAPVRVGGRVISHVGTFQPGRILETLQAAKTGFQRLGQQSQQLADTSMSAEEATMLLIQSFGDPQKKVEDQPRVVRTALEMFQNNTATGGELLSAYNTAWGLLNCVTEYFNHYAANKDAEKQLNSLWLGNKASQQQKFLESISSLNWAKNKSSHSAVTQSVGIN